MNLNDFWQASLEKQQETLQVADAAEMEAEAEAHHLLVHDGKLIKPEDYPCNCELQDPEQCFQDMTLADPTYVWTDEEQEDEQCSCPCHRYYEPY